MKADPKIKQELKYWSILQSVMWACANAESFELIKARLVREYGVDAVFAAQFGRAQKEALDQIVSSYEKVYACRCGDYGGDDSFSDMLWHVVGSGKVFYDEVVRNPKVLDGLRFKESFSYVLPIMEDIQKSEFAYHEDRAYEGIGALYIINKNRQFLPQDQHIISELIARFECLVDHDPEKACGDLNEELYERYYDWPANKHHAKFSNILSDAQVWLLNKHFKTVDS